MALSERFKKILDEIEAGRIPEVEWELSEEEKKFLFGKARDYRAEAEYFSSSKYYTFASGIEGAFERRKKMKTYTTALSNASNSVKDFAIRTVACASNEDEVWVDIDAINDGYRQLPNESIPERKDLSNLIKKAIDRGASMLHLI